MKSEIWPIRHRREGNLEAFNRLVMRYQDDIYALVLGMTGQPQQAEAITQNVFAQAWENISNTNGHTPRIWLLGLAADACIRPNQSNRLEAQNTTLLSTNSEQLINQCLLRLNEKYRLVVILADIHKLNYDEIVAVTGIPFNRVSSMLNCGRTAMRDCLLACDLAVACEATQSISEKIRR